VLLGELLSGMPVGEMVADYEPVREDATVAELFDRLPGARRTDLAVVDRDGNVVGLVSRAEFNDVLTLRRDTVAF